MIEPTAGIISENLGELAALGAALFWVFTSLAFAAAGRRVGPTWVNLLRMIAALGVLLLVHRLSFGLWLPKVDGTVWTWLALSGLAGLAIGDQFLFTALVYIGPRLSTLLMTLTPPATAMIAWPMLDEPLSWLAILGIAITIAGVAWVALERPENPSHRRGGQRSERRIRLGLFFGAMAGLCQATGLVLAKKAMLHATTSEIALDAWSVTLIRMIFGVAGIIIFFTILRLIRAHREAVDTSMAISAESERLPPPRTTYFHSVWPFALLMIAIGVFFGPVCGVWMSMVAIERTETGIAATLMAMTPVFILPFAAWIEKERITWRAVCGAVVAVLGVAILMLTNGPPTAADNAPDTARITQAHDDRPSLAAHAHRRHPVQ